MKRNMALKALTKEQQAHIESLVKDESLGVCEDGVKIDDFVSFDKMAEIVDYLRQPTEHDIEKDLFEKCWLTYKRKGSKKKSLDCWKKLTTKERHTVLPHIKAYSQSRELQYMKDFERYLRDKVFMSVVYNGNQLIYDPSKANVSQMSAYMPICGGALSWNDYYKCYLYVGSFNSIIPDGYTDDMRPDGARIMLNNGQGFIKWNSSIKKWEKD